VSERDRDRDLKLSLSFKIILSNLDQQCCP